MMRRKSLMGLAKTAVYDIFDAPWKTIAAFLSCMWWPPLHSGAWRPFSAPSPRDTPVLVTWFEWPLCFRPVVSLTPSLSRSAGLALQPIQSE